MKIHQLSIDDVLISLHTSAQGLTTEEAAKRLQEFGPNQVQKEKRQRAVVRFLREFVHLFAVILWIGAALSFFAEYQSPGQGMMKLGVAILIVILVSGIFSFLQEYRAERTLASLLKLLPRHCAVLRSGRIDQTSAETLVPGDIVLIEQGELIPADCRLIEAFGFRVNNANVTGESIPQLRNAVPSVEMEILQSKNIVLAGTSALAGTAQAVVFATGMDTEFGKIAHLTQAQREISPLRRELASLSRWIVLLAVSIGFAFFAIGRIMGVAFWDDFIFAIGIIVAMVPEGLLPTLTLALVLAAQRMSKRNVLVRHLPAVEALGSATIICTDKTGTLTKNRMTVRAVYLGGRFVDAVSLSNVAERYWMFFAVGRYCHDLKENEVESRSEATGDPMEMALFELSSSLLKFPLARKIHEIPFDADRMRVSTVVALNGENIMLSKGAPETLLPLCTHVLIDGEVEELNEVLRRQIFDAQKAMARQGLRVLAHTFRSLSAGMENEPGEENFVFAGLSAMDDPPRPEVADAIRKCHEAGIKIIMVTGDHPETALSIGREIGLVRSQNPVVVTGANLRNMTGSQLQIVLDAPEILFARLGADQKLRIVRALKRKKEIVAVTGDGVNDAPALKSAHIGIAMGISGTNVAQEAADMILLDDNFASIVNGIEEGRAVFENIRKFLTYILAHNVPELIPYLCFGLWKLPLALTPIQILSIDMGTDSLTALGLGTEKPEDEIMQRHPGRGRLFDLKLALRSYLFLGLIEAFVSMVLFFGFIKSIGWAGGILTGSDSIYRKGTTVCLASIVVMQIANVFLCRSETKSIFKMEIPHNPLILWGVIFEIVLLILIVFTPQGNEIFGTETIPLSIWIYILPTALLLLLLEESRKWVFRRFSDLRRRNRPKRIL